MMLRIGLVTSEFPPDRGGVETYAWQLARELGQRPELQVIVYAPHKSARVTAPPGVTIKPILTSCMNLDWAKFRNEQIDVWHALSAAHTWIATKNVPTIVSVHGNDFLAPYPLTMRPGLALPGLHRFRPTAWRHLRQIWQYTTRRMLARALPQAQTILSNSRYTAEILRQHFPTCADKIRVAWVGVDPSFFTVAQTPRRPVPQILTVSRLSEPRKNVGLVIQALATLRNKYEFEYTIAGEGPLKPDLERQSDALGLSTRVHFVGRVSDQGLRDLYATADLFVLTASITPDSHEGFGIVYLEAAASGVPSLAARLAGAAEAVAEGRSGFFVHSPDVESISNALDRFLGGAIQFEAGNCRAFARQFDWGRVADLCEAAYRQAAPTAST